MIFFLSFTLIVMSFRFSNIKYIKPVAKKLVNYLHNIVKWIHSGFDEYNIFSLYFNIFVYNVCLENITLCGLKQNMQIKKITRF